MKRYIRSSSDEYLDEFLEEFAYETCDLDEEFTEDEFAEFKDACRDNGFKVTKRDFQVYLDKVKNIQNSDQYKEFTEYDYDDLVRFADDEIFTLRMIAAEHPSTTPEILAKLADDETEWVREAVASNKSTPPEVLAKLANDKVKSVRDAARKSKLKSEGIIQSSTSAREKNYIKNSEYHEDEDTRGEFELVTERDLDIALPDRIVLTDNGAYDLEKQGMDGVYTWVGYKHNGSRSDQKMARAVNRFAYDVVAPALADYVSMPEDNVEIDDYMDSVDMVRVWVELA